MFYNTMKDLQERINESMVSEARDDVYSVSISAIQDEDNLPVTCSISCPREYRKQMEKWLTSMVGDEFSAAEAYTYNWQAEW